MKLANAAKTQPIANVSAVVTFDGAVYWFPPTTLKSVCPLDLSNFPFDEQMCTLQFCSWMYWGDELNLTMTFQNMTLTPYLFDEHNEWQIIHSFGNRNVTYYGSYPFIIAEFHLHLQRRAPYYRLALITPTFIALLMTILIFWVPPIVQEKFVLGGICEVILSLVLAQLYWVVPRSGSNVPGLVILCGNALMFTGLSIVIALIVNLLSRKRSDTTPPSFIRYILSGWRKQILCLPEKKQKLVSNTQLLSNEDETDEVLTTTDTQENSFEWLLLGIAIDRLSFLIYSAVVCVLLFATFG